MARDYRKALLVAPAAALPLHHPASCLPARVTAGDIASDVVSPASSEVFSQRDRLQSKAK